MGIRVCLILTQCADSSMHGSFGVGGPVGGPTHGGKGHAGPGARSGRERSASTEVSGRWGRWPSEAHSSWKSGLRLDFVEKKLLALLALRMRG